MATWYITDGSLPFLEEFPQMIIVNDMPNVLGFNSWKIIDGDLPFKSSFPEMYTYKPYDGEGINNVIKGDDVVDNIYYESTMLKGAYLGEFKVFQQSVDR